MLKEVRGFFARFAENHSQLVQKINVRTEMLAQEAMSNIERSGKIEGLVESQRKKIELFNGETVRRRMEAAETPQSLMGEMVRNLQFPGKANQKVWAALLVSYKR